MRTKNIIASIVIAIITGLFGLFQGWFSHQPEESSRETNQTTHGPQSPIIENTLGNVQVSYGVPQAVIDRWMEKINEQGEAKEAKLRELGTKLRDFSSDLANRPTNDEVSKQILQHLSKGSFSDAEAALIQDLDRHIESRDFQTASVRAEDLHHLSGLQLAPSQAIFYANLADNLRQKPERVPRHQTEPAQQQYPPNPLPRSPSGAIIRSPSGAIISPSGEILRSPSGGP